MLLAIPRGAKALMRVTVDEGKDEMVVKIEGRLVEPWISELESTWRSLQLGTKRLSLDISEMLFVDYSGKRILKDIVMATNCEIRANSPLTRDFANEIVCTARNPLQES
jgi:hypothetical protein